MLFMELTTVLEYYNHHCQSEDVCDDGYPPHTDSCFNLCDLRHCDSTANDSKVSSVNITLIYI